MENSQIAFLQLLDIMKRLRKECPWDKEQTFESIRTLTIEETHELSDAILQNNLNKVMKELGDLLLHIVFYAEMGSELNAFSITDVIENLNKKLIYRHPHVFGQNKETDSKQVEKNWEQLKLKEKDGNKAVLEGIPTSLPAMIKAFRIQDKARGIGFDWTIREQVWDKVEEEINELKTEIRNFDVVKTEEEFGDLLFSLINAARLYNINPENALEKTNQKFIRRFNYLEEKTIKSGLNLKNMTLEEMDKIWNEAKKSEHI